MHTSTYRYNQTCTNGVAAAMQHCRQPNHLAPLSPETAQQALLCLSALYHPASSTLTPGDICTSEMTSQMPIAHTSPPQPQPKHGSTHKAPPLTAGKTQKQAGRELANEHLPHTAGLTAATPHVTSMRLEINIKQRTRPRRRAASQHSCAGAWHKPSCKLCSSSRPQSAKQWQLSCITQPGICSLHTRPSLL